MQRYWLVLTLAGCSEWPRYDHLSEPSPGQADATIDPRDALWDVIHWVTEGPEIEVNDHPPSEGIRLDAFTGWIREGSLDGWGWDAASDYRMDPDPECGHDPAFPPQDHGYYAGDIDWYGVIASESGTLCATVRFDLDDSDPGRRYDLMLYRIDDCGIPIEPARLDDIPEGLDEAPVLGYPLGDTEGSWGTPVWGTENLGVVLAGWAPEDEDADIHYTLAVSLVNTTDSAGASICPRIPEDL